MARYIYQDSVQDGRGNAVEGASITVYEANTTTKATIYAAVSGGSADADSVVTSDTDGTFSFYVDDSDYAHSQRFKIIVSLTNYTSQTLDYIQIFPDPSGSGAVEDDVYGAGWNGDTTNAPSQNAVYDKIEDLTNDFAPIAKGVTNGDSHDHSGGDGAQIDHTTLSNIGTNTHAQVDTHITAISAPTGILLGSADGTFDEIKYVKSVDQYSGSLATAVSAIGGSSVVLYVDGDQTISGNLTVPSNIELHIVSGRTITVDTGITLTINNFANHPPQTFFSCSGTGKVTFAEDACPYVLAEWFGAARNGSTDDQPAIAKAILAADNIGRVMLLAGEYACEDSLTLDKTGFYLHGQGRDLTQLFVTSQPSLDGFIYVSSGEPGPRIEDLHIKYDQTDTAVRGSLALTKSAIYCKGDTTSGQARTQLRRLKISKVYNGILMDGCVVYDDAKGNHGGSVLEDIQMSALNIGIRIDGALDSMRVDKFHFWPFDLTANQQTIFYDATTVGLQVGRCDDLKVTNGLFINDTAIEFTDSGVSGNVCFGSISDTDFDNTGRLLIQDGSTIRVTNCFFSKVENTNCIRSDNSTAIISNCQFLLTTSTATVIRSTQDDSDFKHFLGVHNCYFDVAGNDVRAIYADENDSGAMYVSIIGNHIHQDPSSGASNALIECAGAIRGSIVGNHGRDEGTDSNSFIKVATDDYISVVGNMGIGRAIDVPAPFTTGKATANTPAAV